MYHRLGKPQENSMFKGHYVEKEVFEAQLKLLKNLKFQLTNVSELLPMGSSGTSATRTFKPIAITFDDGYQSFYEVAMALLKKIDGSATVFVVSGQVGETNSWDIQKGDSIEKLMDWDELKISVKEGFEVGSHTINHVHLSEVDDDKAREEIFNSKQMVEERLNIQCDSFCYPYGSQNQRVLDLVQQAGYKVGCSTCKGLWRAGTNPYLVPRINIRRDTGVAGLLYKLWRGRLFDR